MNASLPDKSRIADRFSRSLPTYDEAAIVQAEMAEQLVARLSAAAASDRFRGVLELGCGTGLLTRRLLGSCRIDRLVLNDLVEACGATAQSIRNEKQAVEVGFVAGDMESADFPGGLDLIVSNAAFQWAVEPAKLLTRMAGLLVPGGILAFSSFGPSNLREIARLTGASLPYWSLDDWRRSLAAHFDVIGESECLRTLRFPSARAMLRHLKLAGVNALGGRTWTPEKTKQFCRLYECEFMKEGQVPLTYHPLIMIARKKSGQ